MVTNQVIDSLMNHRSIRTFQDKEVPEEVVKTLLSAGIRAANGGNLQRYSFIIIDNKDTRGKLAAYDKFNNLSDVPLIIISIIDNYRLKRWFDLNNAKYKCITSSIDFFMPFYDAVIALHNISIAAESLGLGTYYDGNVLEFDIKELFDVPDYTFPVGMLCIGYPKEQSIPNLYDRLPLDAVVHQNKYKIPKDEEINEWYKEKKYLFQTLNTKDRLKELSEKGIYNIAQAYAHSKFSNTDLIAERNNKIRENIKKGNFLL